MSTKRKVEEVSEGIVMFEVIGKEADWEEIEDGAWAGFGSGKDPGGTVVALSSRNCLDIHRWTAMPSLASFSSLKELDLHKSRYMRQLDASICELEGLETLILTQCEKLSSLPEDIGKLKSLKEVSSGL